MTEVAPLEHRTEKAGVGTQGTQTYTHEKTHYLKRDPKKVMGGV